MVHMGGWREGVEGRGWGWGRVPLHHCSNHRPVWVCTPHIAASLHRARVRVLGCEGTHKHGIVFAEFGILFARILENYLPPRSGLVCFQTGFGRKETSEGAHYSSS